jgi:tetratricopeptide (TPR) repeat protein
MTPCRWIAPVVLVAAAALVAPGAGYAADTKSETKAPKKPVAKPKAKPEEAPKADTPKANATPPKPEDAAAKPPPPPGSAQELSAEDEKKALAFLAEGNKAFKTGKFSQAEEAYRKAYELKPVHDIAGNLAMAEFALNKPRDAAEHLAFAIRLFPITGDKAVRDAMVKTFEQCRQQVATVKVSTNVTGALVSVDGKPAGESPLPDDVFVDEGSHTLEAKAPGYKPLSKPFSATKGGEVSVSLTLVALPRKDRQVFIEVPAKRRSVVPGVVLFGVAAAAAGGGVGLLLASQSQETTRATELDQIRKRYHSCSPTVMNYDGADTCGKVQTSANNVLTFRNLAIGSFVGAGVAAVAGVTYLLWPNAKPKPAMGLQVGVVPVINVHEAGLLLSGSF